jgi:hypothetical protein
MCQEHNAGNLGHGSPEVYYALECLNRVELDLQKVDKKSTLWGEKSGVSFKKIFYHK